MFEYTYTRLASHLRRSARSGIITVTENEKCLETGKRQNPLMVQNRSAQGAPTDLLDV